MTAEDKCKVLKDLLIWSEQTKQQCLYMEEKIYAVRIDIGVVIVKADSFQQALDKVWKGGEEE